MCWKMLEQQLIVTGCHGNTICFYWAFKEAGKLKNRSDLTSSAQWNDGICIAPSIQFLQTEVELSNSAKILNILLRKYINTGFVKMYIILSKPWQYLQFPNTYRTYEALPSIIHKKYFKNKIWVASCALHSCVLQLHFLLFISNNFLYS